jgi:hypothetical protein
MTGGDPVLCVVGAAVLAVLTAAVFAIARGLVRRRNTVTVQ